MWRNRIARYFAIALFGPLALSAVGCRTTVGGGSFPPPNTNRDDVQYFPAAPEFMLTKQIQAMEEYKREREESRAKAIRDVDVQLASDKDEE